MTEYRWVCPYCFDFHEKKAKCKVDDLKVQIDGLWKQIEFLHMKLEEKRKVFKDDSEAEIGKA